MNHKLSKKRYELLQFREGVIEKIKGNTALCDLLIVKLKTDSFGLYRMIRDNSQSLMNYAILKDISKYLKMKIELLVEDKITA